ncbi:Hypothetical_protein [Hexamita inflata]|nr:Hypothetical protein HINF_LOCUS2313 [Hexamita inflata]CAI9919660.1 Hypothetical protein HINF_LOCUS7305 [Hexamita inflata]
MTDRISQHVNDVSQQPGQSPKFVVQDPKSTLCGWIAIIYGLQIRAGEALQLLEQFSQIVLDQKEKLQRLQNVITRVDNISGGNYFVIKQWHLCHVCAETRAVSHDRFQLRMQKISDAK